MSRFTVTLHGEAAAAINRRAEALGKSPCALIEAMVRAAVRGDHLTMLLAPRQKRAGDEEAQQKRQARNAEIVRMATQRIRPGLIAHRLKVSAGVVYMVLKDARKAGIDIPNFPRGGKALAADDPPPSPPVRMIAPVRIAGADIIAAKRIAPQIVSIAEPMMTDEQRLRDLVVNKRLPLTSIAAMLRKPYREIIADMERLGISNARAR